MDLEIELGAWRTGLEAPLDQMEQCDREVKGDPS